MIQEFFIVISLLVTAYLSSLLFFKYISPKEKKELNSQREKLFKDVERHLKKENFIEVIETFEQIAQISEKLGELGVADEFKERANNIRRQLGQEVKADFSASQDDINAFIQKLMVGPYGDLQAAEIIAEVPQAVAAESKSLIEEGEEILARLARFKGGEVPQTAATPVAATPPPVAPPFAATPQPRAPPTAPPTGAAPPVSAPPMSPPVAVPTPPRAPPIAPPTTPPPPAKDIPFAIPTAEPIPAAPFTQSQPEPMAFVIDEPEVAEITPVDEMEFLNAMEEPQLSGMETFTAIEPEIDTGSKKKVEKRDEKAELLSRIEQELPYLPDKKKKGIIKELLKRPEGKLRETWFKVYVHKNKQYATKPS